MNEQPFQKRAVAICSQFLANYRPTTILFVCAGLQFVAGLCYGFIYFNAFTRLDWAFVFGAVVYFFLGLGARKRPLICLYAGLLVSFFFGAISDTSHRSQFPLMFFDGQLLAMAVLLLLGLGLLNEAYRQRNAFNRYQELFRASAFTIMTILMGAAFFFINSHVNEIANQMTEWQNFKIGTRGFTGTQLTELFDPKIQELRFCQIALFVCGCLAPFFLTRAVVSYRRCLKSNPFKKEKTTNAANSSDGIEPTK